MALIGSSPACRSELWPYTVRAPRLASNFHVQYDALERRIYVSAGKIVIYNFWSITRIYYTVAGGVLTSEALAVWRKLSWLCPFDTVSHDQCV